MAWYAAVQTATSNMRVVIPIVYAYFSVDKACIRCNLCTINVNGKDINSVYSRHDPRFLHLPVQHEPSPSVWGRVVGCRRPQSTSGTFWNEQRRSLKSAYCSKWTTHALPCSPMRQNFAGDMDMVTVLRYGVCGK